MQRTTEVQYGYSGGDNRSFLRHARSYGGYLLDNALRPRHLKVWPPPFVQGLIDHTENIAELVWAVRLLKKGT